jgi:FxsC-like protein
MPFRAVHMTNGETREFSGGHHPYFYLSYARASQMGTPPDADPDRWVKKFFQDLVDAVRQHASAPPESIRGFMDQQNPPGLDKKSLNQALSTAQAFVPLYSAGYFSRALPGREWACFRERVGGTGHTGALPRSVPVLWAPLPDTLKPPGLDEAIALGGGQSGYAENGLRALLKISSYRPSYLAVIKALAQRIVELAENSPIGPSEVTDIDEVTSEFMPAPLAIFAIEIAAPTILTVAEGRDHGNYGRSSAEWRPFGRQMLPAADYARQVIERLDFKPEISGVKVAEDPRIRRPGVILIDPWFIADESGRATLRSAVTDLPKWVMPLVVLDPSDDARTHELADQVQVILRTAHALPTEPARRGARGVRSLERFLPVIRDLVAAAETHYLRYRSGQVSSPPGSRPGRRRRALPAESPLPLDPSRETPDA